MLDVANALMVQMSEAFQKNLFTERAKGARPIVVEAHDEREQAAFVANEIAKLHQRGLPLSDIAVLFRASRHAFALEVELANHGIPFVKYGEFRFIESAHIKDVLAHVRLVDQPGDDLALARALLMREGIGKKGARQIHDSVVGGPLVQGLRTYRAKGKIRASMNELADCLEALQDFETNRRDASKPPSRHTGRSSRRATTIGPAASAIWRRSSGSSNDTGASARC